MSRTNWRLAESLKKLREQINEAFPDRLKASDGSVGDLAHRSRPSDHNPNAAGVVCAIDITHDPKSGCTGDKLAADLVKSRDPRIKYLIWNRRMVSSYKAGSTPAWTWRPYSGANAHSHHIHISVQDSKALYDSRDDWELDFDVAVLEDKPLATPPSLPSDAPEEVLVVQPTEQPSQTVESQATGTQINVAPNNLVEPAKPVVSQPGDKPIEATTGGFKSMMTSAVGWITGTGAGVIALLKDNRTLLIIAAVLVALAGLLYFIRQLILDRDRLRIAADPTKWNAK